MSDDEYITESDIDLETAEGLNKIKNKVKEILTADEVEMKGIIEFVLEEEEDSNILEFIVKIDKDNNESVFDMFKIVDCTGFKEILIDIDSDIPKSIYDDTIYNKLKNIINSATKKINLLLNILIRLYLT